MNPGLLGNTATAVVGAARRDGAVNAVDIMTHFFINHEMFIVGSTYWNMAYGQMPGAVLKDKEGMSNIRNRGIGSSADNLHGLVSDAVNWLKDRRFGSGAAVSEIQGWIDELDLPLTKEVSVMPYGGIYPQHEPYGIGIGAMPGRVVWAYDPGSVDWDGNGYWWELDRFDENVILSMVNGSIVSLGG